MENEEMTMYIDQLHLTTLLMNMYMIEMVCAAKGIDTPELDILKKKYEKLDDALEKNDKRIIFSAIKNFEQQVRKVKSDSTCQNEYLQELLDKALQLVDRIINNQEDKEVQL